VPGSTMAPLHARLRNALQERILTGELPPHSALPGERPLMTQYGVSRATIRQAIGELCSEGVLYRLPRRGTYVAAPKFSATLGELIGFSEELQERGLLAETAVLGLSVGPAEPGEAESLEIPAGTPIMRIERLVRVEGAPLFYDHTALPEAVGEGMTAAEIRSVPLYTLIERRGVRLGVGDQTIEAVRATAREAARLQVSEGAPLLRVRRITRDADGRVVEAALAHYRSDRYQYRLTLRRQR
jgi:GntR family transcriptional regulator